MFGSIRIWALVTLTRPQIKVGFREKPRLTAAGLSPADFAPSSPQADKARSLFYTTATAFLIGIGLLGALIIGLVLLSILLPAVQRARHVAEARSAAVREAIKARLTAAIVRQLGEANIQYDAMELTLSPGRDSGQCTFSGLRAQEEVYGTKTWNPVEGKLIFSCDETGSWQVQRDQQLQQVAFTLEPAPKGTQLTNQPSSGTNRIEQIPNTHPPPSSGNNSSSDE